MKPNVVKIDDWSADPFRAKKMLSSRLEEAKEFRKKSRESIWQRIEDKVYPYLSEGSTNEAIPVTSGAEVRYANATEGGIDGIAIPQIVKNVRFLHSQLSANPPSVTPAPASADNNDHRAAKAADAFKEYGIQHYEVQEVVDLTTLNTILYGFGATYSNFNPKIGKPLPAEDVDVPEGHLVMSGDYEARECSVWSIYLPPNYSLSRVPYVFEEFIIPKDEADFLFPGKEDVLEKAILSASEQQNKSSLMDSLAKMLGYQTQNKDPSDYVKFYVYFEKGAPQNALKGRHCFHLEDGTLLSDIVDNPAPGAKIPYAFVSDIDVPGIPYGETTVSYALNLSDVADDLENMIFDNVDIHGDLQVVMYETGEVTEESVRKSPVHIVKVKGTAQQAPTYLNPPSLSVDIYQLRGSLRQAIDDVMGVTEILQGQVPNRMSGFSAETAINAANTVRHRLYNKYTKYIKDLYELFLGVVHKYFKLKHKIKITGKEGAVNVAYFSGNDLDGDYVIHVQYGETFSLDPLTRRAEILQLKDLFKEAGLPVKTLVKKLRFGEFSSIIDRTERAEEVQLEIFERMETYYWKNEKPKLIPAEVVKHGYHQEMAEAAENYFMTEKFRRLPEELKEVMWQHYEQRVQLAAKAATGGAAAGPPGPEAGGLGGLAGMLGGAPAPGGPELGGLPPEEEIPDPGAVI